MNTLKVTDLNNMTKTHSIFLLEYRLTGTRSKANIQQGNVSSGGGVYPPLNSNKGHRQVQTAVAFQKLHYYNS